MKTSVYAFILVVRDELFCNSESAILDFRHPLQQRHDTASKFNYTIIFFWFLEDVLSVRFHFLQQTFPSPPAYA